MKKILAFILVLILVISCSSAAFAVEADPYISIVNPAADTPVTSTTLLVSVKITTPETVVCSVLKEGTTTQAVTLEDGTVKEQAVQTWTPVFTSEPFTTTNNLSFYTEKLENVSTGTYLVKVNTVNGQGETVYTTTRTVVVKEKPAAESVLPKAAANTGFLQTLLKSIFGH